MDNTYVILIRCKAMVDTSRHNHQVILVKFDPYPMDVFIPHIEIAASIQDISYFFIFVQVFVEEYSNLLVVNITHYSGRNGNLIAVLVLSFSSNFVNIIHRGTVKMCNSKFRQVFWGYCASRVVWLSLVTLVGR